MARTIVITPEQERVMARAMDRVRELGVYVPEGNHSDHSNEIVSICAWFLELVRIEGGRGG